MADTSMCFADLSAGDQFDSNEHSCGQSKRYLKLSPAFQTGISCYANAVEMQSGDPESFEPEHRVSLVQSSANLQEVAYGQTGRVG